MGKIIKDKTKLKKKYIKLKCNGCEGCEFHYCTSSMSQFGKDWDDLCKLYKYESGDYEGHNRLLAAEGYSGYKEGIEMMKVGLHPEGRIFKLKEVKKFLKK